MTTLLPFGATFLKELLQLSNRHLSQAWKRSRKDLPADPGTRILFQGDSITDAGRDRSNRYPNTAGGLGSGYVHYIVAHLLGNHPERNYQIYNRGISGDKVFQLAERWEEDCLNLKPDFLGILIGVNDFWHTLSLGYKGTVEEYENDYRDLLKRTKEILPDVKLVIGEPFAVQGGTAIDEQWLPFADYRQVSRKLAEEFDAMFIPYHDIFDKALERAPAAYWCPDGVHPSIAGNFLMKESFLQAFL